MFGISIVPSNNTNLISATASTMLTNVTHPVRDVNIWGNNKKLSKNRILENYEIITNFYLIGKQYRIGIFQLPDHLYGIIKKFLPDILTRSDMDIKDAVRLWNWNKSDAIKKYGHISMWNTKYVTNMSNLFSFGSDEFNEDISNWNVQNVKCMDYMFLGAVEFNGDLSKWNVQNVESMDSMFKDATKFNCDLNKWNVKNVKCMDSMFQGATKFNGDLSNWNVQNVESMRFMFKGGTKFNCDLSNWNAHTIKKLSNIKQMFDNCNISKNHKIKFCIQDSSTEGYNYYIYGDYSYYDKDGYYSDKYIDLRHKDEQRQKFELRRKHGKIKVDSLNYDYSSYIQIYNNYEEDGYTTEDSYDSDYWDDPDYDD